MGPSRRNGVCPKCDSEHLLKIVVLPHRRKSLKSNNHQIRSLTSRLELGIQVQHLGLHVSYDNATSWRAVIHAAPLVQCRRHLSEDSEFVSIKPDIMGKIL